MKNNELLNIINDIQSARNMDELRDIEELATILIFQYENWVQIILRSITTKKKKLEGKKNGK